MNKTVIVIIAVVVVVVVIVLATRGGSSPAPAETQPGVQQTTGGAGGQTGQTMQPLSEQQLQQARDTIPESEWSKLPYGKQLQEYAKTHPKTTP